MEPVTSEDLKAFERRFTEVIAYMQPAASRWRALLLLISMCTSIGAYQWLTDPLTKEVSFSDSLYNHAFFTGSLLVLLLLFLYGIHKRVVAPSIIASRCRQALVDFNMSCDDMGRLILKPKPASP